ncbi:MAG: hypothetical protein KDC43_13160 [Saprospiraceae bacterium]|nr:hypothetical protein [Saprospiraceae bacterium]MCB0624826.1 hypothetical protein [Saprospiraceae bacterium]MCB0679922.1 hypothetical protein [Saprospiraceae bacterium]
MSGKLTHFLFVFVLLFATAGATVLGPYFALQGITLTELIEEEPHQEKGKSKKQCDLEDLSSPTHSPFSIKDDPPWLGRGSFDLQLSCSIIHPEIISPPPEQA